MEIYSPLPGAVSGALLRRAFRGTPLFVQIMVVHFALVPLFINPRDGLLVTSGLMSADFARELRASYGRSSPASWRSPLTPGPSEIFRAGIQSIDGQMEASPRAGHAVVENHAQGDPAAGVSPYSAAGQ
ncbi:hypothetical protein BANRA_05292 [Klebsiella pneumoniae]|nr:hypothetical protein BANRA_05292 [Klebsiella pneumoniae]